MSKQESRTENRLVQEMKLSVQGYTTPDGKKEVGSFRFIRTIDISGKGMQIELDRRIPPKSVLRLRLQTPTRPKPFLLAGEVRWSYPDKLDPTHHYFGLRLLDEDDVDQASWESYVRSLLKTPVKGL